MSPADRLLAGLRDAALLPYWSVQLLTSAKSFEDNRLIGSPKLNARGLHVWRVRTAARLASRRRARLASQLSREDRETIDRDGFLVKRDFLPAPVFRSLVAEAHACRRPVREMTQGDAITRRIALDDAALASMRSVAALLYEPDWRGPIRYAAASAAAPMVYLQAILSHAATGASDPQVTLHADTFHPTAKAWLFLTDVAEEDGPFVYVPGSHRLTQARLDWEQRMSVDVSAGAGDGNTRKGSLRIAADIVERLGLPPPMKLPVPANTLVVADTFGFHARGVSTRPSVRVEIWAFARRNPFVPWSGLDLWAIGPLERRKMGLYWTAMDYLEVAGLSWNPWRSRGQMTIFDPPQMARAT